MRPELITVMRRASIGLLCAVSLLPVAAGLAGAAASSDAAAWRALLATPGLARSVLLSIWTGLGATALSVGLAHAAIALAATRGWSARLRAMTLPLLATPHLALGIGLVMLLSPSGLLLRALSPWATGFEQPPDWATVQDPLGLALICGLVMKETPFLILVLSAALAQVRSEHIMVQANALGYGRLKAWMVSVAPLLQRQVRLAIGAVLIFALTNVEMALPLGPTSPPPLSVLLLGWFTAADLGLRAQAFAGVWLLLGMTLLCLGSAWGAGALLHALWRRWAMSGDRAVQDAPAQRAILILLMGMLALGVLALVALCLRVLGGVSRFPRLLPNHVSAAAWHDVRSDLAPALATTFSLGMVTALICLGLVLVAAEILQDRARARARLGMILFIPLLLPQMAFLFGWQVVLVRLRLDGTIFAVSWTHALFALPYVWAVIAESRAALDPVYVRSARALGAGAMRIWICVTAPLLLRSILLALALGFSVSATLYLPSLLAGGGRVATLATEAAASVASGSMRSAAASGLALALAPLLVFGVAFGIGHGIFRNRRAVPG
jgi:putative thiamine transport system permease protein